MGYYGQPNQVIKNNKAQRTSKREKRKWEDYIGSKKTHINDPIKATPELLAKIKRECQREKMLSILIPSLLTFIFFIVLSFLFLTLNKD